MSISVNDTVIQSTVHAFSVLHSSIAPAHSVVTGALQQATACVNESVQVQLYDAYDNAIVDNVGAQVTLSFAATRAAAERGARAANCASTTAGWSPGGVYTATYNCATVDNYTLQVLVNAQVAQQSVLPS